MIAWLAARRDLLRASPSVCSVGIFAGGTVFAPGLAALSLPSLTPLCSVGQLSILVARKF